MKVSNIVILFSLFISATAMAAPIDDPVLTKVMIDELEIRDTNGPNPTVLDGQMWIGKDLNKFWLKTDIEQVDGKTEEAEVQALYSRAIYPYWDLQAGVRRDYRPEPQRDWLVLGLKGLAPYFFEVDATAFFGENGRSAARLEAEYELLFTQRLILSPEVKVNFYGKDDPELGIGSGLSDMEAGLRLRYEIRREFAPYIGINWTRKFGQTADFARAAGGETEDTQLVAGLRIWF